MKRICLVTHTQASHSVEKKVGGWYNAPLTPTGKTQAIQLAGQISELGFDLARTDVYASDLLRAAQTADLLLKASNRKPMLDPRLREMSFGDHEGMPQEEHSRLMIPVSPTGERMDHRICEGAESRREVALRITSFVDEIMASSDDVIVVTHGFAATFFIAAFQQIDVESMGFLAYKLTPGSLLLLEEDNLFENRYVQWIGKE